MAAPKVHSYEIVWVFLLRRLTSATAANSSISFIPFLEGNFLPLLIPAAALFFLLFSPAAALTFAILSFVSPQIQTQLKVAAVFAAAANIVLLSTSPIHFISHFPFGNFFSLLSQFSVNCQPLLLLLRFFLLQRRCRFFPCHKVSPKTSRNGKKTGDRGK